MPGMRNRYGGRIEAFTYPCHLPHSPNNALVDGVGPLPRSTIFARR